MRASVPPGFGTRRALGGCGGAATVGIMREA